MDTFVGSDGVKVQVSREIQKHFTCMIIGDGRSEEIDFPEMDSETLRYIKAMYSYADDDLPGLAHMMFDPKCRDGEFVWKVARAATELGAKHLMSMCVFALYNHPTVAVKYLGTELNTLDSYPEAFNLLLDTVTAMNRR